MSNSNVQELLRAGNEQFTTNIFQEAVKKDPGESCVLSAFSVLSPLAQLGLASVGSSHDEILTAIGMPNDNVTKDAFVDVNTRLQSVKGVELKQANKIYVRKDFTLNDKFVTTSKNVFNSEIQNIDFGDQEGATNEINAWVEDHSNKHIKNLIDPTTITELTAAILVNAVYFKGNWQIAFDKARDGEFFVNNDKKIIIPLMHRTGIYKFGMNPLLEATFLEIQYEGGEISFVAVLPDEYDGIDSLIEKFKNPTAFPQARANMWDAEVIVTLPKFKIETTTDLKQILQHVNVTQLFDEYAARLDNLILGEKKLYISDAIQKTLIEVTEEGGPEPPAKPHVYLPESLEYAPDFQIFEANHPFLFYIMQGDTILLNGVYGS